MTPQDTDRLLVKIVEELSHKDREFFDSLTDSEKSLVISALSEMIDSGSTPANIVDTLWEVDYIRKPVDVITFLTDKYYMGMQIIDSEKSEAAAGAGIYGTWAETLEELFSPSKSYWELILSSSIGTGKTSCAVFALIYKMYRMSCLRDPQTFYGLLPGHGIVFGVYNIFKYKAQSVAASYIREGIERCKYFTDNFPMNDRKTNDVEMPNSIKVSYGSCIAEGSMVQTTEGDVAIEQVDPARHRVISFENGHVVEKAFGGVVYNGRKPVFRLDTEGGCTIRATQDHKFMVVRDGVGKMLRLHDIRPGDRLIRMSDLPTEASDSGILPTQVRKDKYPEVPEVHMCRQENRHPQRQAPIFSGPTMHTLWSSTTECKILHEHQDIQREENKIPKVSLQRLRGEIRQERLEERIRGGELKEIPQQARVQGENGSEVCCLLPEECRKDASKGGSLRQESGEFLQDQGESSKEARTSEECGSATDRCGACAVDGEIQQFVHILHEDTTCQRVASGAHSSSIAKRDECMGEPCTIMWGMQLEQECENRRRICVAQEALWECYGSYYGALDIVLSITEDGYANTYDLVDVADTHVAFVSRLLTSNSNLHAIGENVFSVMIDETEFMKAGASEEDKGQAMNLYNSTLRRMESRYMRGGEIPGLMVQISSKASVDSYLADRIKHRGNAGDALIIEKTSWDVKPWRYGTKRFPLYTGDSYNDPRILDESEVDSTKEVMWVPVEHRMAFEEDMQGALRDLANVATGAMTPLVPRRDRVFSAIDSSREHPFSKQEFHIGLEDDDAIEDYLLHDRILKTEKSVFRPVVRPDVPRFIHIDLAVSGDAVGFAMGHVSGVRTIQKTPTDVVAAGHNYDISMPMIYIDMMLRVIPVKGSKIRLSAIRDFVFALRSYGYQIAKVSADTYQCLAAGTLVNTHRGLIPIEQVVHGDTVMSLSGPNTVTQTFSFGNVPTKTITTSDGNVITATEGHRLRTLRGWNSTEEGRLRNANGYSGRVPMWKWTHVRDIRAGDIIQMLDQPVPFTSSRSKLQPPDALGKGGGKSAISGWNYPEEMTTELAEWMGLIWGDGYFYRDGIRLTVGSPDETEDAIKVFSNLFGVSFSPCKNGSLNVSSRSLVRWFAKNNMSKPNIPEKILESGTDIYAAFLRGLFAADGSVERATGHVSLSTKHRKLASDVTLMLKSLGFESRISSIYREEGQSFPTDATHQYVVHVRGSRKLFGETIGFSYSTKQARLENHYNRPGRRIFTKVIDIQESFADVYDLSVANDPSYVANGFISHNSTDMLQQLIRGGFNAEVLSVDQLREKDGHPYAFFREAIMEERISYYGYDRFLCETINLEKHDTISGGKSKWRVDHPARNMKDLQGNPIKSSKDVADAVCGVVKHCMTAEVPPDPAPTPPIVSVTNLKSSSTEEKPRFMKSDSWAIGDDYIP